MRQIDAVVQQIVGVAGTQGETLLMRDLHDLINGTHYRAPEGDYWLWEQLGNILEQHLGAPDEAWKLSVQKIMRGES